MTTEVKNYNVNTSSSYPCTVVVKASDIATNGPDKFVERQIVVPFVPVPGMLWRITDEQSYEGMVVPRHFIVRTKELMWDAASSTFRVNGEVVDGDVYEFWHEAKPLWEDGLGNTITHGGEGSYAVFRPRMLD